MYWTYAYYAVEAFDTWTAVATVLFMIMLVYISYFLWRMYQDEKVSR